MIFGETFLLVKLLSTFAGDIIDIQDLIISTATGPAVRNSKAQTATAAVVDSTRIGAYKKTQTKKKGRILLSLCYIYLLVSQEVRVSRRGIYLAAGVHHTL